MCKFPALIAKVGDLGPSLIFRLKITPIYELKHPVDGWADVSIACKLGVGCRRHLEWMFPAACRKLAVMHQAPYRV